MVEDIFSSNDVKGVDRLTVNEGEMQLNMEQSNFGGGSREKPWLRILSRRIYGQTSTLPDSGRGK